MSPFDQTGASMSVRYRASATPMEARREDNGPPSATPQAQLKRSTTRAPTISSSIAGPSSRPYITHGRSSTSSSTASNKGKGKATIEVIDMTLSSSDDEAAATKQRMSGDTLSDSSSSGIVIIERPADTAFKVEKAKQRPKVERTGSSDILLRPVVDNRKPDPPQHRPRAPLLNHEMRKKQQQIPNGEGIRRSSLASSHSVLPNTTTARSHSPSRSHSPTKISPTTSAFAQLLKTNKPVRTLSSRARQSSTTQRSSSIPTYTPQIQVNPPKSGVSTPSIFAQRGTNNNDRSPASPAKLSIPSTDQSSHRSQLQPSSQNSQPAVSPFQPPSAISPVKKAAIQRKHRMSSVEWEAALSARNDGDGKKRSTNTSSAAVGSVGAKDTLASPRSPWDKFKPTPGSGYGAGVAVNPSANTPMGTGIPSSQVNKNSPLKQVVARLPKHESPRKQSIAPSPSPSSHDKDRSPSSFASAIHASNRKPFSTQSAALPRPTQRILSGKKRVSRVADADEESYRPQRGSSTLRTPSTQSHVRPTRVRPEAGAYTLPTPDTSIHDWPRLESTHGADGWRREEGAKEKSKKTDASFLRTTSDAQSPIFASGKQLDRRRNSGDSTGSALTSLSSRSPSPNKSLVEQLPAPPIKSVLRHTPSQKNGRATLEPETERGQGGPSVSPTKSLSATPAKGIFPQLLPDDVAHVRALNEDGDDEDEEREEVEEEFAVDRFGMSNRETEVDPLDMLAEFEDFDWASSDGEAADETTADPVANEAVPSTGAEHQEAEAAPKSNSQQPRATTPVVQSAPVAPPTTPGKPHSTPSQTTLMSPQATHKRPHPGSTPSSAQKRRAMADKYEQLLREENERAEKEREAAKREEREIQRKLDLALESDRDEPDREAEVEDLGTFLTNNVNISPRKPKSPSSRKSTMRTSLNARKESRQAKAEREEIARKQAKIKAKLQAKETEAFRLRRQQDREFDGVIRKAKKGEIVAEALREINGLGEESDWPALDASDGSDETDESSDGAHSGPTTDLHARDTEPNESMDLDGEHIYDETTGIDNMIEKARRKGMVIDEDLVRDAKAGKGQAVHELDWEGFWGEITKATQDNSAVKVILFDFPSQPHPIWDMVVDLVKQEDTSNLATTISLGVLTFVNLDTTHLFPWLLKNAIHSSDTKWAQVAREAFLDHVQRISLAQLLSGFNTIFLAAFASLGARASVLQTHPRVEKMPIAPYEAAHPITMDREVISAFLCQSILSTSPARSIPATPSTEVSYTGVSIWLPILLLLHVDKSTSAALKSTIIEAIQRLLAAHIRDKGDIEHVSIARAISQSTAMYGDDVHEAVLAALGERIHQTRAVHRWLGMEYLVPGSIDKVLEMAMLPLVPPVPTLIDALESIYETVQSNAKTNTTSISESINYTSLNNRVTFLFAAMSDLDLLLEQEQEQSARPMDLEGDKSIKDLLAESDLEEIRVLIRMCRDKISDQSNGTAKSMVKARLHQLYEINRLVLTISLKKRIRAKKLGKGLKAGTKGQTKLDFSLRPKKAQELDTVGGDRDGGSTGGDAADGDGDIAMGSGKEGGEHTMAMKPHRSTE